MLFPSFFLIFFGRSSFVDVPLTCILFPETTSEKLKTEKTINNMSETMNNAIAMSDKTMQDYIATGKNVNEIMDGISEINQISSENARSVEEIASAAEHLNKMTDALNTKLSVFRT